MNIANQRFLICQCGRRSCREFPKIVGKGCAPGVQRLQVCLGGVDVNAFRTQDVVDNLVHDARDSVCSIQTQLTVADICLAVEFEILGLQTHLRGRGESAHDCGYNNVQGS